MAPYVYRPAAHEYHVAWLCALPDSDRLAAEVLLDQEYAPPQVSKRSGFKYTYGRMGDHNVVIACLALGETGNVNSSRMIAPLKELFYNISVYLLVGTAGGIPCRGPTDLTGTHELRLGDVVIATVSKANPGIVQVDHGKQTTKGFTLLGHLDKPSNALRQTVSAFVTKNLRYSGRIPNLEESREQTSRIQQLRHPRLDDRVFQPDYDCHSTQPGCAECDISKLVRHLPYEEGSSPNYHIGLMLSSEAVMKDGVKRDSYLQRYPDALAFEMEAAGIDEHGCLVVRGIANYADAHKSKEWQGYAAANAAATAKYLLSEAQFEKRSDPPPVSRGMEGYTKIPLRDTLYTQFHGQQTILQELENFFISADRQQTKVFVLHGKPGYSMTAIANQFYARCCFNYWAVWRLNAATEDSLRQSFIEIAAYGPPELLKSCDQADTEQVVEATGKWLAQQRKHWLIIYDNADSSSLPSHIRFLNSTYGSILITTKDPSVVSVYSTSQIEVTMLEEQKSVESL